MKKARTIRRAVNAQILKKQKEIQQRAEKRFKSLMIKFIEFIGNQDSESPAVQDKIKELNDIWIAYCENISGFIMPSAKDELMNHINKVIEGMKPVMEIKKAEDDTERSI